MTDYSKMSMEELFAEIKKIPDWNRYAWPEVFYEKFGVEKPKAKDMGILECLTYQPPPYESLNEGGQAEVRGPVEGGLRPVIYSALPVSQTLIPDEKEKPAPKLASIYTANQFSNSEDITNYIKDFQQKFSNVNSFINQNDDDKKQDSPANSSTLPKEDTTIKIQV